MFNPAYLTVSRHRVFYFRWPLPRALHLQGRQSTIKVSLRTRDPKQATSLSRHLGYVAQMLVSHGAAYGMTFGEIRRLLSAYFSHLCNPNQSIAKCAQRVC